MKTKLLILFMVLNGIANAQWQQTSLNSGSIGCFAIKGDTIFAGTESGNGYVYLSSNNGNSWFTCGDTGLTNSFVLSLAIKGDTIFAGCDVCTVPFDVGGTYAGVDMFFSTNNGSNWDSTAGLLYDQVLALAIKGNNIFAGTNVGVFSSNNGASWNITGLINLGVESLAIKGDTIFAGTIYHGVLSSSNNGNSWDTINTGLPVAINVMSLAISGNNIFAGTWVGGSVPYSKGSVYLSTNNGNSWDSVNTGLPAHCVRALAIKGDTVFAGIDLCGVFYSTNNGSSWTAMNTGLPSNPVVNAFAIKRDTLFAGIDSVNAMLGIGLGVWKIALSDLNGITEISYNNTISIYPNPATDNLTIEAPQQATIEITNIQGQLIETLVTTGNKTIIDVSLFAKGMYFIKVKTEKGVTVKKFVKE